MKEFWYWNFSKIAKHCQPDTVAVAQQSLGHTGFFLQFYHPNIRYCPRKGHEDFVFRSTWIRSRLSNWPLICRSKNPLEARSCALACKTNTTQNQPHQISNTQRTENKTTDVAIQQHSRKLLMMDILMSEACWAHKKWNKIASGIKLVFHSSTITMMHGPINIR